MSSPNPHLDFSTQAAVLFGMSANSTQVTRQLSISCSSSDCEWEEYLSLAVCSARNGTLLRLPSTLFYRPPFLSLLDVSSLLKTTQLVLQVPMAYDFPNQDTDATNVNLTAFVLPNNASINNGDPGSDSEQYAVTL